MKYVPRISKSSVDNVLPFGNVVHVDSIFHCFDTVG